MNTETYTPGHSENAVDFMSQRTFESHGRFFIKYLRKGLRVLDCGCGPGTITLGIASLVEPGMVTGIDFGESQIELAAANAAQHGIKNASFQAASCYSLPFADSSFDVVFSHALLEHLSQPVKALKEILRVLKPDGYAGVCCPDLSGLVMAPESEELTSAVEMYVSIQQANGGDLYAGHKLGTYLSEAGFRDIQMDSRYECYPSLSFIGDYLSLQLEEKGHKQHAQTIKKWSKSKVGLFAQAWVSVIGRK